MSLKLTFVEEDGTEKIIEDAKTGQSLMEVARSNGVAGILADCGGNVSQAAKLLGIHRRSLQRKLAKYPPRI